MDKKIQGRIIPGSLNREDNTVRVRFDDVPDGFDPATIRDVKFRSPETLSEEQAAKIYDSALFSAHIARVPPPAEVKHRRELLRATQTGRKMKLDFASSRALNSLTFNVWDLMEPQAKFAKDPFEHTIFEMAMQPQDRDAWHAVMLIVSPDYMWLAAAAVDNPKHANVIITGSVFNRITGKPESLGPNEVLPEQAEQEWAGLRKLWMAFCLALGHQRTVINDQPARHQIIKGKRVAYAAHSVVTLNLSSLPVQRIKEGTPHGPVRAHEVRGHWVNYNRNPHCDHMWTQMAPEVPGDERERWHCGHCGQRRTWRKSFQRGDASLGYVTHEYRVTGLGHAKA